jgi:hypothetical protein
VAVEWHFELPWSLTSRGKTCVFERSSETTEAEVSSDGTNNASTGEGRNSIILGGCWLRLTQMKMHSGMRNRTIKTPRKSKNSSCSILPKREKRARFPGFERQGSRPATSEQRWDNYFADWVDEIHVHLTPDITSSGVLMKEDSQTRMERGEITRKIISVICRCSPGRDPGLQCPQLARRYPCNASECCGAPLRTQPTWSPLPMAAHARSRHEGVDRSFSNFSVRIAVWF